jgi:hypothetical protein
MNKSDSIKNIAAAIATFHIHCGKVAKSADNPFFKSKYAPLPEILEAIAEPLKQAKLSFAQFPDGDSLTTILMHPESGEWMEASYAMHPVKSDPQAVGSAITYARRYALGAILGLNIDEDDDGNKASAPAPQTDDKPWLNEGTEAFTKAREFVKGGGSMADVQKKYKVSKKVQEALTA